MGHEERDTYPPEERIAVKNRLQPGRTLHISQNKKN